MIQIYQANHTIHEARVYTTVQLILPFKARSASLYGHSVGSSHFLPKDKLLVPVILISLCNPYLLVPALTKLQNNCLVLP